VLGFDVSARTVAKYVRVRPNRGPSPSWRERHASSIGLGLAILSASEGFWTLHVFFVVQLENREILHVEVTRHPTADSAALLVITFRGNSDALPT
jgi:hypothetical protein